MVLQHLWAPTPAFLSSINKQHPFKFDPVISSQENDVLAGSFLLPHIKGPMLSSQGMSLALSNSPGKVLGGAIGMT